MFRVDVWEGGGLLANFQEKQQELEQGIRDVANDVDGRLLGNNKRNNNQEFSLKELIDAIMGVKRGNGRK